MGGKSFDSLFEDEKAAPGQAPVQLAGPKSFDSYFADEANIPEEGLNTIENKRGGAVRKAVEMGSSALAQYAAGRITRPMSTLAQYFGDAVAGGGTEKALQALGISEESPTMVALASLGGPVGRLLGSSVTGIPKYTPGYKDAARSGLTEHVRALPGQIIPHGDPKVAYDAIQGNMNTIMPNWPELGATVAKHATQDQNINWNALRKMAGSGPLKDLMENIEQSLSGVPAQIVREPAKAKGVAFGRPTGMSNQTVIPAQPPGMTFENARANVETLSQLIRSGKGPEVGVLKDVKRAILTDLENMPAPPGMPLAQWKEARAAYKDQKTTMALNDVIESNIKSVDGIDQVNPDGILKALRTNDELKERLTPVQMKELDQTLRDWANASGGTKSKLMSMIAGMVFLGGPIGALTGLGAAEVTTKALMSEGARKMIGNIIANPTTHNIKRGTAIIAAAIRGAFDRPGDTPMPFETEITPGKVMGTLPTEARTDPKAIERSPVPPVPTLTPEDIKAKITKEAKSKGLPPALALATASVESGFDQSKVGTKDDVGFFQITPIAAKDVGLGLADRHDPDKNIKGGTDYLNKMYTRYKGDEAKALAAYNAGPTAVDKGKIPASTQAYVVKVLKEKEQYDKKRRRP